MDYVAFGKRVRFIRRFHDMTQEQLADVVGISTSFLGHIERGTRAVSVETLFKLCVVLGVSADYLIGI